MAPQAAGGRRAGRGPDRPSPVARETVRALATAPAGRRVVELERLLGEPVEVVRTLNRMQQEGLVRIQVDPGSLELTVRPTEGSQQRLRDLLKDMS